jgi:hypothetical protein
MDKTKVHTLGDCEEYLMKLGKVCDEKELDFDEVITKYGSKELDSLYMNFNEVMAGGAIPESAFTHEVSFSMCEEIQKVIDKINEI